MNLAHRGASHYAPENTFAAFYKGLELGANGIETDIQASKDGVLFLLHDHDLKRTTNGEGHPQTYTWNELQQLDAGSWFSPVYAGERLVTLEQFLHHFGGKRIHLALELKADGIERDVLAMIRRFDVGAKTTVTSFAYEHLRQVRAFDPDIRLGHLIGRIDAESIARMKAIVGAQLCPSAATVEPEDVELARREGFEVRAWKASTPELMNRALACGVDGMTVNFPDKLNAALSSRESAGLCDERR